MLNPSRGERLRARDCAARFELGDDGRVWWVQQRRRVLGRLLGRVGCYEQI